MTTQQIEQGRHILKMIEGLAGYTEEEILRDHVDTLDEIDFLTALFFNNRIIHTFTPTVNTKEEYSERFGSSWAMDEKGNKIDNSCSNHSIWPHYCTSRDALKAARPDGWRMQISEYDNKTFSMCFDTPLGDEVNSPILPTEYIAELHAITQAKIWELENGGRND